LEQNTQLATQDARNSIKDIVEDSQNTLQLIKLWENQQFFSDPSQIEVVAGPDKREHPVTRRFIVGLYRDIPLTVNSDNLDIKVSVEESPWAEDRRPLVFEKQIVVEISPKALTELSQARISITTAQLPEFQVQIPVHIHKASSSSEFR
jgi:hypothetical protein